MTQKITPEATPESVQEERLKTDCNVFIDRAIEMIKEDYRINRVQLIAGYNGIMSLLQYAKESHSAWAGQATPVKRDEELPDDFKYPTYLQAGGGKKWDEMTELEQSYYENCKLLNALAVYKTTTKRLREKLAATPAIDKSNEAIEAINFILANPFDVHIVEQKAKELLKLFTSQGGDKVK